MIPHRSTDDYLIAPTVDGYYLRVVDMISIYYYDLPVTWQFPSCYLRSTHGSKGFIASDFIV